MSKNVRIFAASFRRQDIMKDVELNVLSAAIESRKFKSVRTIKQQPSSIDASIQSVYIRRRGLWHCLSSNTGNARASIAG